MHISEQTQQDDLIGVLISLGLKKRAARKVAQTLIFEKEFGVDCDVHMDEDRVAVGTPAGTVWFSQSGALLLDFTGK